MSEAPAQLFATVALDSPLDRTYTYLVPPNLHKHALPGAHIVVPLGRSNRPTSATILSLSTTPPPALETGNSKPGTPPEEDSLFEPPNSQSPIPNSPYKQISAIHSYILPIPDDLLALAQWISSYYLAPIGMTLATMVPAAVKKAAKLPADILFHLADKTTPPDQQLAAAPAKTSSKTKKIFEKIHFLLQEGPLPEPVLLIQSQIARPMLKRLLVLHLLKIERQLKLPESPIIGADLPSALSPQSLALTLSPDQQIAHDEISSLLDDPKFAVRLIHGVTGSGKTELYIRAIQKVVDQGKRAIVLVPEISLTPQAVKRFTARFSRVAILHSGLKDKERHLHYHAIATGWAQVIVGARSAIFAPAANLGLIVVDEEHDPSYKQDNLPKYHGRDTAIRRAQMLNIPILLGSATPALESWHNAHPPPHNNWKLLSLRSRPLGTQMPRVLVVDMKGQAKERRGLHILSTTLEHHLRQMLEQKKQAIFLLNRRGYAHYVMCPRCDWVMMCDNCDTTMVVHRTRTEEKGLRIEPRTRTEEKGLRTELKTPANTQSSALSPQHSSPFRATVQCHYCLTAMQLPSTCPLCQARLTHLGQGTQRAEDELLRKFPTIRLKRMDSDSMHDAADYQKTLDDFGNGHLDLLIGTQMISKGLDFPNVQLVGVLNSDLAMTIPDFRAAERTFQLICQVAGRAGRPVPKSSVLSPQSSALSPATVIVQTFQPHEPAIAHACNHDYLGFVKSELPHRQEFGYPPFGRLVRIVLAHKGYTTVHTAAQDLARLITALTQKLSLPIRVTGPFPPPLERLVELYRVEIILFAESPGPLQRLLASLRARGALASKGSGQVTTNTDVDPIHML